MKRPQALQYMNKNIIVNPHKSQKEIFILGLSLSSHFQRIMCASFFRYQQSAIHVLWWGSGE